ncbi:MAG: hypothetical protein JNK82_03050, partial [Myxococcaceae bacterium]|nr:hypothetical protein [Myxococcaceae bacterium]
MTRVAHGTAWLLLVLLGCPREVPAATSASRCSPQTMRSAFNIADGVIELDYVGVLPGLHAIDVALADLSGDGRPELVVSSGDVMSPQPLI